MKHPSRFVAPALIAVLALTGCVAEPTNGPEASDRVCIVLPDADPAGRWKLSDRPAFEAGIVAAGLEVDVQSADGDALAEVAAAQLEDGCGVLVLVDDGAASGVAATAAAAGVPVIAYDGAFAGAQYVVAFDENEVGRLQGQSLVDAFTAVGRDPGAADIVYLTGPDLGQAERDGALAALQAGGVRPVAEPVVRDGETVDVAFSRALAALSGVVNGVWAPGEASAAAAAAVLAADGRAPVPLVGGAVTDDALRRILAGWQTSGVLLPIDLEVQAVIDLAVSILQPADGATAAASADVETILVAPRLIGPGDLAALVAEGVITAETLCGGDVLGTVLAEKCTAAGIG